MRSHHIRTVGLLAGLIAVLGMASIAAGASLTDQQIGRQIERRLSKDAFRNVNVSVQASVVSLSGTVPSLWAKEAALAKARELADVTSVVSDALDIERAESDGLPSPSSLGKRSGGSQSPARGPQPAAPHQGSRSHRCLRAALAGSERILGLALAGSAAASVTRGLASAATTSTVACVLTSSASTEMRAST